MAEIILEAQEIEHSYEPGKPILRGINLRLHEGEAIVVEGPSGVGKTTLLEILGTMRSPSAGQVKLMGEGIYNGKQSHLAELRGRWLGFVFQESLLLPDLTIYENCRLAVVLSGRDWGDSRIRGRFEWLMEALRLDPGRASDRPAQLSTGERQRVAVVRALMHEPRIIIADEPTGNLDIDSSELLLDLFLPLVNEESTGIIVATHDPLMAQSIGNRYLIEDKKIKRLEEQKRKKE